MSRRKNFGGFNSKIGRICQIDSLVINQDNISIFKRCFDIFKISYKIRFKGRGGRGER